MYNRIRNILHGILLYGLIAALISGSGMHQNKTAPMMDIEVQKGEAVIWYLGHCGYAIRTVHHLLIFDYIELEEDPQERGLSRGFVDPSELRDMNVCVLVTHSHIDHFDESIFTWEQEIDTVRYFFGWQLSNDQKYYYLEGPRAKKLFDDIEIFTVNSHHSQVPEVAYLVKVDGLVLYHGGDYQGRMGRDAPSNVLDDMKYLKTNADSVDIFFIGAWTGEPYMQSIHALEPTILFPMHDRKKEYKYKQFASDVKELGIDVPVICPEKRGDCYHFRNGEIMIS
ncbi:MAG: MBL fold metallo-hydrolase, partial [candidate division WOR-3 bacterium]